MSDIPTAVFDLYVDGELKDTVEADSRGQASRSFRQRLPEYASVRYQGRVEIRVREHKHEPAAGNISKCVFCQADINPKETTNVANDNYSGQMILDADITEYGWEIVLRFGPEDMEAGWSAGPDVPLSDDELRVLAPTIGDTIVEALIRDRALVGTKDN